MEEKVEWVEIVEPRTGDHMFANLRTGQCLWEPPNGAKVKKTHDNQWWELYDASTRRYYYYNATSQKTVWRKPKDGDIIPLAKLQILKAKESVRKNSVDSNSKQRGTNSIKESIIKETNKEDEHKSNNGQIITVSSFDNESDISDRSSLQSDANTKRFKRDLELALRGSAMTADSNGQSSESELGPRMPLPRSSSTGDSESDNGQKNLPFIDKTRSQTVKEKGLSLKQGRKPPPKPPRVQVPLSSEATTPSDTESNDRIPSVNKLSMPDYADRIESTINPKPDYEESKGLKRIPTPDYSLDEEIDEKDSVDGAGLSAQKPPTRAKSVKPSRPPPIVPTKPVASNSTTPPKPNSVPTPPPVPTVKIQKETRRQLPKINFAKERADSDKENEEKIIEPVVSPFTKMIEEMEEYSGNLSSPTEFPGSNNSRGLEPSSSFDDPNSPSGTLLPQQKSDKYSAIGNGSGKQFLNKDLSRKGSDGSFAEKLNSMGMPLSTAALVDACDPASNPGTPKTEQKLSRMHSDTTIVVRKSPSPANGDKTGITNRPMSLMPAPGKSRDAQGGSCRGGFVPSAPETAELTREVPLSKHRKGFLRKRMSIASMLSWSKVPIKKPMVMTRDKQLRKDAIDVFKLTLQYMGDKASRKSSSTIALEVVSKGWSTPGLRDEIYIQLCKQTTGNEKTTSLTRGWELITMCLALFPPSNKFHSYLEGYIYRHLEPDADTAGVPVSTYAKHCYKQLERICQSGAKRGLKRPTVDEIEQAKQSVFNPSMFGNTLEDIMELQEQYYKSRKLPWIMTTLAELVLANNGLRTEGIFRVPGDIDEVNSLKVMIDKWKAPNSVKDPHIPGSLLKLWFRDLYEPLIPNVFYERCIRNCDNSTVALSIVYALPELNSLVFCYLIRFLQAFMLPEIATVTKMDENNLAMVWAPNCLRCPSDDPMQIFENTRKEMTFLRTLMQNLDTSFLEGVM